MSLSIENGVLQLEKEAVILPVQFDASELLLPGNLITREPNVLYGYDPTTGTGLLWFRRPAPHWQLIQSVTRAGFQQWAEDHYANLLRSGVVFKAS